MPKKPWLTRKETQTLLTTLKVTAATGVLSLTLAGWGLLARADMTHTAQTALAADSPAGSTAQLLPTAAAVAAQPTPTAVTANASAAQPAIHLNIVRWTSSTSGDSVAVVQDRRGRLWYVMGSDVPRIEQGLQSQFQPQLVQITTRTRSS